MTQQTQAREDVNWGAYAKPIHRPDEVPPAPSKWMGESDIVWKDSSWIPFWDVEQDCFGTLHTHTTLPGQKGKYTRVSFCHEGTYRQVLEIPEAGGFSTKSVSYEPTNQGVFTVDSPELSGELFFKPKWGIANDWGNSAEFGGGKESPLNANIGGIDGHGTFTLAGRTVNVNVEGVLDRNWGWRDESAQMREWMFVSAVFPSFALNYWRIRRDDGTQVCDGFLTDSNGVHGLKRDHLAVRSIRRDPAALHLSHEFDLQDGRTMRVTATKKLGHFWVPMGWERVGPTCGCFDEFQRLRIEDGNGFVEEGAGLVEQAQIREIV
jgi:hypothetical protein